MRNPETDLLIDIPKGFSRSEILLTLSRLRSQFHRPPVSVSTFYRWCGELSITPKYRYSKAELQRLAQICAHYSSGGTSENLPDI